MSTFFDNFFLKVIHIQTGSSNHVIRDNFPGIDGLIVSVSSVQPGIH